VWHRPQALDGSARKLREPRNTRLIGKDLRRGPSG
jgi:hypothetical protein